MWKLAICTNALLVLVFFLNGICFEAPPDAFRESLKTTLFFFSFFKLEATCVSITCAAGHV